MKSVDMVHFLNPRNPSSVRLSHVSNPLDHMFDIVFAFRQTHRRPSYDIAMIIFQLENAAYTFLFDNQTCYFLSRTS